MKKKRVYDKRNICLFCKIPQSKIGRHIRTKHHDKVEVIEASACEKNEKDQRLQLLVNQGNHEHNLANMKNEDFDLLVLRRPLEKIVKSDYCPCPFCYGWVTKHDLWQHAHKTCPFRKDRVTKNVHSLSNMLIEPQGAVQDPGFQDQVLATMANDQIGATVRGDDLIRKVGFKWFQKLGVRQAPLIRQKMRQLARLLIELRKDTHLVTLKEFLRCDHFDAIISAAKSLTEWVPDEGNDAELPFHKVTKASLGLAIGHGVKKAAKIEWGEHMRLHNKDKASEMQNFLTLFESEWTDGFASHALRTKKTVAAMQSKELPASEDLKKLKAVISNAIEEAILLLTKDPTNADLYASLSGALTARIVLFNRRRAYEASNITIKQYLAQRDNKTPADQLVGLSEFELHLADT